MYDLENLQQCGKRFKTKFKRFSGLNPTSGEVRGKKLTGTRFLPVLNRV